MRRKVTFDIEGVILSPKTPVCGWDMSLVLKRGPIFTVANERTFWGPTGDRVPEVDHKLRRGS